MALRRKLEALIHDEPGGIPLSGRDITFAARKSGISPALVRAVMRIEARGQGFIPGTALPIIRYERHIFRRETGRAYDDDPYISGPFSINSAKSGRAAYHQLRAAAEKDAEAAVRSTSWGMSQVMGFNAALIGFENLEDFLVAMFQSERLHLMAFFAFCNNAKLNGVSALEHLQREEFDKFARIYNGRGYRRLGYHIKLEQAYNEELTKERDRVNRAPTFPMPDRKPVDVPGSKTKHLDAMPKDDRTFFEWLLDVLKTIFVVDGRRGN